MKSFKWTFYPPLILYLTPSSSGPASEQSAALLQQQTRRLVGPSRVYCHGYIPQSKALRIYKLRMN